MRPSQACVDFVKSFEGFRATAYKCPAGVWTIGYGCTENVSPGDTVTEAEAEQMLSDELLYASKAVDELVEVELTQNEYDALTSFVYNVGREAFRNSTLLRMINNDDKEDCGPQFDRWNKAGGVVLAGLTRRRAAERAMFEST